jgi:plasmid replication initiation protein
LCFSVLWRGCRPTKGSASPTQPTGRPLPTLDSEEGIFTLDELRGLLGVPKDKLLRFPDFNKYALQPALREVNALSDHTIEVGVVKRGKRVAQLILTWMEKTPDQKRDALKEVERCSVGRAARIRGTVEKVTF